MKLKSKAKIKKMFLSTIVGLVVLAFIVSFFSMVAFSGNSSQEEPQGESSQVAEQVDEPQPEQKSSFNENFKKTMIVGETPDITGQNIAKALNVYNSFNKESKIVSFDGAVDDYSGLKQALKDADIYFEQISSDTEKEAWKLVLVDEEGIADLNQ